MNHRPRVTRNIDPTYGVGFIAIDRRGLPRGIFRTRTSALARAHTAPALNYNGKVS